jgi:hypothetical protein
MDKEEYEGKPDVAFHGAKVPQKEDGHYETVAGENRCGNEAPKLGKAQGACQKVREAPCEHEVQEHGIAVSFLGRHQIEKESQRVEDCGFEVGPKGHASENVRIPVGDGSVEVDLIIQELLHGHIKLYEVDPS